MVDSAHERKGALGALSGALRDLRLANGGISLRELSHKTDVSKSTIADALRGEHLPRWPVIEAIVRACSGNPDEFRKLWYDAMDSGGRNRSTPRLAEQGPTRCFLSYSVADEEQLHIVEQLREDIQYWAQANFGRYIDVPHDRQSVQWGDDWKKNITTSLAGAAVLIPIITMQYLATPACREEFLLFYSGAQALGLTKSAFPVVLLGHEAISTDSPDLIARILAGQKYFDMREALMEGVGSSTWRRSTLELTRRLIRSIESIEAEVIENPVIGLFPTHGDRSEIQAATERDLDQVQARIEDHVSRFEVHAERYTETLSSLSQIISAYAEKVTSGVDASRDVLNEFARDAEGPCLTLAQSAADLESEIVAVDVSLRRLRETRRFVDDSWLPIDEDVNSLAAMGIETADQLSSLQQGINEFRKVLVAMELASYRLRTALRPLRTSLQIVESSMDIVRSWTELTVRGR